MEAKTYTVTGAITVTITPGETFTPEDMRTSRHPGAWDRRTWSYTVTEDGKTVISGDDITGPVSLTADAAFHTLVAFIGAESDAYRGSGQMGQATPDDGWYFGGGYPSEFCYLYADEFACAAMEHEDA
jgi:hypothetical protein